MLQFLAELCKYLVCLGAHSEVSLDRPLLDSNYPAPFRERGLHIIQPVIQTVYGAGSGVARSHDLHTCCMRLDAPTAGPAPLVTFFLKIASQIQIPVQFTLLLLS
jgi:hypothetical protein